MKSPKPSIPVLESDYYFDNFVKLLHFVTHHYKNCISEEEQGLIDQFWGMNKHGQRLFLRMGGRKGSLFRADKLNYTDFDLALGIEELMDHQWLGYAKLDPEHPEAFGYSLALFTLPEIKQKLKASPLSPKEYASLGKRKLLRWAMEPDLGQEIREYLKDLDSEVPLLHFQEDEFYRKMLFFYFADADQDMSIFVIKDLGHRKFQNIDEQAIQPYFPNRKAFEDKWAWANWIQEFRQARLEWPADAIFSWMKEGPMQWNDFHPLAWPERDRLYRKVGEWLKQQGLEAAALELLKQVKDPKGQLVYGKLLNRLKKVPELQACCREWLEKPSSPALWMYAQDRLAKWEGKQSCSSARQLLKDASVLHLSAHKDGVEFAAMDYFESQGCRAFYSENHLWRGFFGLFFWEEMFDDRKGAFYYPLQESPVDFKSLQFYDERKEAIHHKLNEYLERPKQINKKLLKSYAEKQGTANPMVLWHPQLGEQLEVLITKHSPQGLAKILEKMAHNPSEHVRGFPDLMVLKEGESQFIEVKSPNDQLSDEQFFWSQQFEMAGLQHDILRVYPV